MKVQKIMINDCWVGVKIMIVGWGEGVKDYDYYYDFRLG